MRFLLNAVIFLGSAALGLWVAWMLIDGFTLSVSGLIIAAVIFALLQALLSPFIFKMTHKYASAFTGGVGLLSTFVALWITTLISSDLEIKGVTDWVLGVIVVWLVTALATWLLPMFLLKEAVENRKDK